MVSVSGAVIERGSLVGRAFLIARDTRLKQSCQAGNALLPVPIRFTPYEELKGLSGRGGLSTVHNVTVPRGGDVITVEGLPSQSSGKKSYAKRGDVQEFTKASRRRQLRAIAEINQDEAGLPTFITLTYPLEWPRDGHVVKEHLRAFRMALDRRFPESWGMWRLEYQRRGAPHFHLLLWGVQFEDAERWALERGWLSFTWYRICRSGDLKHLAAGTRWEAVRSWRGVRSYCAKYLGKAGEVPEGVERCGRFWGKIGAAKWMVEIIKAVVPRSRIQRLKRMMRRYVQKTTGVRIRSHAVWWGLTIFLDWGNALRLIRWACS